jgi:orotate phosphoribosyltransferase
MSEELLTLFRKTGALLEGHFVLRSGLHSREYLQMHPASSTHRHCCKSLWMARRQTPRIQLQRDYLPALGGIIVGQEVARSLGKRHIFVEKEDGKLVLRRGFQIDIVRAHGGAVSAVGVILDRSGQAKPDFGCPFVSLIEMNVETFAADKLPPDLAKIPTVKPGSK